MPRNPDDLTLMSAVAAGDQAATERFAQMFRQQLIFVARRRNVPAEDCEDVAHDTLLTAIGQLQRGLFRGESSPGTWLEKILGGKIADYWRGLSISRQMLDVLMKEYTGLATIPKEKRHFHVLKHSIVTHLLDADADLRYLQDWLGHANIQNTVIYASLVSHSREKKARKYFMKLPRL